MRITLLLLLWLFPVVNVDHIDLNIKKNEVAFTFFDLPDGEAVLMQNEGGNILINTGSEDSQRALMKRLSIYGVQHIDKLLITNSGEDYTGNVLAIVHKFHVKSLLTTEAVFKKLKMDLLKPQIKIMKEGKETDCLPGVDSVILKESDKAGSEAAFVVKFQYGKESVLYMGWADPTLEKNLIHDSRIDSNIVKVGDFANNNGSTSSFWRKVNPQVAIIFHQKGKLPGKRVLDELDTDWIDVYRTHQVGNVSIKLTRNSYQITTIPIKENNV